MVVLFKIHFHSGFPDIYIHDRNNIMLCLYCVYRSRKPGYAPAYASNRNKSRLNNQSRSSTGIVISNQDTLTKVSDPILITR